MSTARAGPGPSASSSGYADPDDGLYDGTEWDDLDKDADPDDDGDSLQFELDDLLGKGMD